MGFLSGIIGGIGSIFGGRNKRKAQEAVARANANKAQWEAQAEIAKAKAEVEIAKANASSGGVSGGMGKNIPYILGAVGIVLATMLSKKR